MYNNWYTHTFTSADDGVGCSDIEDWPVVMEQSCDTLFKCFLTTVKEGLRAGGGISDVLRKPSSHVSRKKNMVRLIHHVVVVVVVVVEHCCC